MCHPDKRSGPDVSVLTAVHPAGIAYLATAHESLQEQVDVAWEWIVQVDGTGHDLASVPNSVRSDARVRVAANGAHLGAAATRNRGLIDTRCELIQNLDADDLLLVGALRAGRDALSADPELAFAFGRTVDVYPDGRRDPKWIALIPFAPGRIEAGEIDRYWLASGEDPLPISPLMWRRTALFAYGGWAALSVLEDTALVLAAASRHPVHYLNRDTQLYRIHDGQATRAADYRSAREPGRRFVYERIRALRLLDGRGRAVEDRGFPADRYDEFASAQAGASVRS